MIDDKIIKLVEFIKPVSSFITSLNINFNKFILYSSQITVKGLSSISRLFQKNILKIILNLRFFYIYLYKLIYFTIYGLIYYLV